MQLPIPDWGLLCPSCGYPLRGLPGHRCPECGQKIDIQELVRPWTRLREPRFTGRELPLPDYGFTCRACAGPLAGATSWACPHCGTAFDLQAAQPREQWFVLDRGLCRELPIPGVQALLSSEHVPHVAVNEMTFSEIYGGQGILADRLRVPSEFYFEILWLLRRARADLLAVRSAGPRAGWVCPRCGEKNPANFELCWKCSADR